MFVLIAHKFLSIIVVQFVQSALTEISQDVLSQKTQAPLAILVQSYNTVQEAVGIIGVSLKQRSEYQSARAFPF